MITVWPRQRLINLLGEAERDRTVIVTLASPREAVLLRQALYRLRRRLKLGANLHFTVEGNTVRIIPARVIDFTWQTGDAESAAEESRDADAS